MKANYYVAAATGKNASNVLCPIVGGVSDNCTVGVLSQVKPELGLNPVNHFIEKCFFRSYHIYTALYVRDILQTDRPIIYECKKNISIKKIAICTTFVPYFKHEIYFIFFCQQVHSTIQNNLANSEGDILKLYADCGTICFSPALAISRFINLLLRALKGDNNCVDCAFVKQTGHIGHFLPYMASIVRLGKRFNSFFFQNFFAKIKCR